MAHVVERYRPYEARLRLRELGRLLPATCDPAELVTAATRPDGLFTPLGRALDEFFDAFGPRQATGDTEARAAGRRVRVIDTVPDPLRPMVAAFSAAELANRQRARRCGGRILADQTLLIHLQVIADFARCRPDIDDWTTVAEGDVEAFLVLRSPAGSHILPSLRAFFAWARQQRLILVDPTRNVRNQLRRRFSGSRRRPLHATSTVPALDH